MNWKNTDDKWTSHNRYQIPLNPNFHLDIDVKLVGVYSDVALYQSTAEWSLKIWCWGNIKDTIICDFPAI